MSDEWLADPVLSEDGWRNLRVFSNQEFAERLAGSDAFLGRVMSGPLTPILGELPVA